MTIPFNIGVLQLSMEPVHETVAMAKACEDAGFDTFWIAEAYPWWRKHSFEARSSTAILAVIASQTTRIQLGWGIISPYTRHPVQIAMEARVMHDLAAHHGIVWLPVVAGLAAVCDARVHRIALLQTEQAAARLHSRVQIGSRKRQAGEMDRAEFDAVA